jgi:hypothetical protein
MRKKITCSLLLVLLACGGLAFPAEPGATASKKIPYDGLTGTIEKLLRAREIPEVVLGSYGYSVEDFIDDDINELFSCDSSLAEYLNGDGTCYYEHFSSIIEDSIRAALDDKSATAYAIVDASEEGSRVDLSIAIEYSKNLLLPIYLETVDGEVKASFAIPSTIRFGVSMSLEIDSDKVLADSVLKGTAIGIDRFEISIEPYEDAGKSEASVLYNNDLCGFTMLDNAAIISLNWNLCDKEGNYLGDSKLTYEQLCDGEYTWMLDAMSDVAISGKVATAAPDDEGEVEISYFSSDLINQTPYSIRITDAGESWEVDIRRLSF